MAVVLIMTECSAWYPDYKLVDRLQGVEEVVERHYDGLRMTDESKHDADEAWVPLARRAKCARI